MDHSSGTTILQREHVHKEVHVILLKHPHIHTHTHIQQQSPSNNESAERRHTGGNDRVGDGQGYDDVVSRFGHRQLGGSVESQESDDQKEATQRCILQKQEEV